MSKTVNIMIELIKLYKTICCIFAERCVPAWSLLFNSIPFPLLCLTKHYTQKNRELYCRSHKILKSIIHEVNEPLTWYDKLYLCAPKSWQPRAHNKLGNRSFSAAGPRLWNNLPPRLQRPGLTFDSVRRSLKTSFWQLKRLVTRLIGAI